MSADFATEFHVDTSSHTQYFSNSFFRLIGLYHIPHSVTHYLEFLALGEIPHKKNKINYCRLDKYQERFNVT